METSVMTSITESTLIPISLVVTLTGAVIWLTKMYMDIRSLKEEINMVTSEIKEREAKISAKEIRDIERFTTLEQRLNNVYEVVTEIKAIVKK